MENNINSSRTNQQTTPLEASTDSLDLHVISVYVANKPGVLSRISMVFARRGFNIESLVVSAAKDGDYSRMTITAKGEHDALHSVIEQLKKLIDVIQAIDHSNASVIRYEMILIKVAIYTDKDRSIILQLIDHYKAKTLDFMDQSLIIHLSSTTEKINAFINMINKFEVVELIRTGKIVMARGKEPT